MNKFEVFGQRAGSSETIKHTILAEDQVEAWAKFQRAYPAEDLTYKGATQIRRSSAPRDLELRAERRDRIRAALPEGEFTAGDFMFRDMTTQPSPGMPGEDTLARLMTTDPAARKPTGSRPMGRPIPGAALLARANAIEALLTDTPQPIAQIAAKLRAAGDNATSPETVRTALRKLADDGRAVRHGDSRYSEWSKV